MLLDSLQHKYVMRLDRYQPMYVWRDHAWIGLCVRVCAHVACEVRARPRAYTRSGEACLPSPSKREIIDRFSNL